MSFIIREMKKEDTKQVQDVAQKSWHSTYEGIIPRNIQENFLKVAYSDEMMEKRLNESLIFVAVMENKIVGFANFTTVNNAGQAELSAIYLYPNHQGKGIGTALLHRGIDVLENAKEIYIDVEKENNSGITFYQAKGCKVIKEYEDNFDGHMLQTIRMCLTV
ncbi:Protease synthase and sporulation negative regulatory protein PAI 1 [Metalysinibacillus saudimassiliensis]|uniref:Protease synthase and sporulation negative regulatory protein PAI 1 n=1 Tax=Metalysinibacillus saudimassiliensis TaxID=1461583 RepID=A0A078M1Y2_9BACL|nr:Protease synthase and sporulation negative regulatory protein PAI 1 [Metalysinibacillus saudimassiliensis]